MTKKELKDIRIDVVANEQVVIRTSIGTKFVSYGKDVCTAYKDGKVELYPHWNYSRITSKYRAQFLGETTKETKDKIEAGIYKLKGY